MLMIPGPIEIHPNVIAGYSVPPPSHLAAHVIEAFGSALANMRRVWLAAEDAQPFVVAGSGTLAMEMAVANLIEQGDRVLLVNSGYFSDRMAEMLSRRGADVSQLGAEVGDAPSTEAVTQALADGDYKALFATHVDTSTGVRLDVEPLSRAAREAGVLSIFDGVCATAAERFEMSQWGADVYLTASQKAIGLPVGLALLVATPRALAARRALRIAPPLNLDFDAWTPIMQAYEERRPSYFSTPATTLLLALDIGLRQLLEAETKPARGMVLRFAQHQRAADAMRAAWAALELESLCKPQLCANTLSALRLPSGVDGPALLTAIKNHGVVVAGGLHPKCRGEYFRVGHMGYVVTQPDMLLQTVEAISLALNDCGHRSDGEAAKAAATSLLDS